MNLAAPFRPFVRGETYCSLAFLVASLPVGAAALGLMIAGWVASGVLLVTPLVVVTLIVFRGAVGALTTADAALASGLLGTSARPRLGSPGTGFWSRGYAVVADAAFWRQQVYLLLRMTFGFALAVGEVSLIAASFWTIAGPITYRWNNIHFGWWEVDTLARSFALVPVGVIGLVAAGWVSLLLGRVWARIVESMLADLPARRPLARGVRRWALAVHAGSAGLVSVVLVLIWAVTTRGYVWPEWPLLALALAVSIHGWAELVAERPEVRLGRTRAFAFHVGVSGALFLFLVLVWALTTHGYFWPMWVALGLATALAVHLMLEWASRGHRLAGRVDALVEGEEAKLRRIERDLHDGAQARLVALGMTLGLAEQRFASDPAGAQQLVAEAREGVGETLRELRDLARGIHPPVLTDRGLCAALATLADQGGFPLTLSCELDERLAPAVETAAYFVVAEAVANAAKHSGAARISVSARRRGDVLELRVEDDGRGGADPAGGGLTGLRRRVRALDGSVGIESPAGGPTVVHVELPCAS